MTRLKDLSNDKMTIVERILSNQGLCKALKYNQPNFLDQPDIVDPSDLIMDKIYPFYKIPDAEEAVSSFILLSFRDYRLVKGAYKSGYANIFTITHKSLVMTDYGFLRYDYMMSEIDELMNNQRGIGIGKPQFVKMDEIFVNNNYLGNIITYKLWEFN